MLPIAPDCSRSMLRYFTDNIGEELRICVIGLKEKITSKKIKQRVGLIQGNPDTTKPQKIFAKT